VIRVYNEDGGSTRTVTAAGGQILGIRHTCQTETHNAPIFCGLETGVGKGTPIRNLNAAASNGDDAFDNRDGKMKIAGTEKNHV
jgi:hypothetical protein